MKRYRSRNIVVGLGLAASVLGIYAYSMFAVKQENFLGEDFDKPGTTRTSSWLHLIEHNITDRVTDYIDYEIDFIVKFLKWYVGVSRIY